MAKCDKNENFALLLPYNNQNDCKLRGATMIINPSYILDKESNLFHIWNKAIAVQKVLYFTSAKLRFNIKSGLFALSIRRTNKQLASILVQYKGVLVMLSEEEIDKETALEALKTVRNTLYKFRAVMGKFESVDYFGIPKTKDLFKTNLDTIYRIEFALRKIAFAKDKPKHKTSEDAEFTARISRRSLPVNH